MYKLRFVDFCKMVDWRVWKFLFKIKFLMESIINIKKINLYLWLYKINFSVKKGGEIWFYSDKLALKFRVC